MAPPARFCPRCGAALAQPDACAEHGCGWIAYRDPQLAVVVLVRDDQQRLLTIRRNHEPAMFEWSWPSGFVDAGERVEDAAAREVREETGVEAQIEQLLGVWSATGEPVVVIAYRASAVGGELRPGPEATAAAWTTIRRRPAPVFPHDEAILRAYLDTGLKTGASRTSD